MVFVDCGVSFSTSIFESIFIDIGSNFEVMLGPKIVHRAKRSPEALKKTFEKQLKKVRQKSARD